MAANVGETFSFDVCHVSRVHGHISTDQPLRRKPREERTRKREGEGHVAFCSYLARTNFHASRILGGATNNYHHYAVDIQIAFLTPTYFTLFPSSLSLSKKKKRDMYILYHLQPHPYFLPSESRSRIGIERSVCNHVHRWIGLDRLFRRSLDWKEIEIYSNFSRNEIIFNFSIEF